VEKCCLLQFLQQRCYSEQEQSPRGRKCPGKRAQKPGKNDEVKDR